MTDLELELHNRGLKWYYSDGDRVIFHADCRDILPKLPKVDLVLTDPVWPNSSDRLIGHDDPYGLFSSAAVNFPIITNRVAVHLGSDSDPRFLCAIPETIPFIRACWLLYPRNKPKGRIAYNFDLVYLFGEPPKPREGRFLIPNGAKATGAKNHITGHPTSRKMEHVLFSVWHFCEDILIDPFLGSGTTLRACKDLGRKGIGIEIEEKYCEIAAKRLSQSVMELSC